MPVVGMCFILEDNYSTFFYFLWINKVFFVWMQTLNYISVCAHCVDDIWTDALTHYSLVLCLHMCLPADHWRPELSSKWIPYHIVPSTTAIIHWSWQDCGSVCVCLLRVCFCLHCAALCAHAILCVCAYGSVYHGAALFLPCVLTMCCSIDSWWLEAGCLLIQLLP